MAETFVIVGASLAGGTAAATLREEGFEGRILLIGEESHPPYERPPLSKEYLRGEAPLEKTYFRDPDSYAASEIETHYGSRVTRVNPSERIVEVEDADPFRYDKLLIATGSRNRHLPIPGIDLEGVLDLRTIEDADRIRDARSRARRVVIVGMGFIGAEVAASLRQKGIEVSVVEVFKTPLYRALGEEIGRVFQAIHSDHGVVMHFEDGIAAFEGEGRVERITTKKGRSIDCDFAVVGVGVEPVTDFLATSGIEIDNGVVVDEMCRTNIPGVFAAGDVTHHYHPVFGQSMRVEHWQNALKQGANAAKNMLGIHEPYDDVHWFWSDQYEHNLQYAGVMTESDETVIRGNLQAREFVVFYLKEGRIVATVGMGRGKIVRQSMKLIKARTIVDVAALKDEDTDLRSLAG